MTNVANTAPGKVPKTTWYQRYLMLITFLIITTSLMDRYVVSILMEQIKADLGLSDVHLGWLVGPAFVITHVLFQLPIARLADHTVRRTLVASAMAMWSLFTIAAGFAKSFPQLFIARMGVGITEGASAAPLASLLSDYFPREKRGRAMSMFSLGGVAGIGAGMILGGLVGQHYGWRVALIAAGVPGVLLAILVMLTVREPQRGAMDDASTAQQAFGFWESLKHLWKIPTYRWLVVGASLSMVGGIGRGAWEPVFLMRVYELDQASAGLIYFVLSPLPSMVGAILGGLLVDKLCAKDLRWFMWMPAMAIGASLPPALFFVLLPTDSYFIWQSVPLGFVFSVLTSVIGGMYSPATISAAQALVPATIRATSHAVWSMAANLVGMGIGPLCVGLLSDSFSAEHGSDSIRYALALVSLVAIPAVFTLVMGARSIRADLGRAQYSGSKD